MNEFFISVLLIFIGLLIVIFLIAAWNSIKLKNSEKRLRTRLQQIADRNGIKLSETDYFQYKIIGLDENSNKVVFVDDRAAEEVVINLDNISECNLIQKQLSYQLELILKEGYQESICIPFYRRYHDGKGLRKKLSAKADYWKEQISGILNKYAASAF